MNARREPSLQLVGRNNGRTVDLATLAASGVTLTGRLTSVGGATADFAEISTPQSPTLTAASDASWTASTATSLQTASVPTRNRTTAFCPVASIVAPPRSMNLRRHGVSTVIWATGYRRTYPWLHVPALDARGEIDHRDGITRVPGLYVLGQRFQRTRRSNFISGVGADAVTVTRHLLSRPRRLVA